MIQCSSLCMPLFWMVAPLNNKLILFAHFKSLIFRLYAMPLRYSDNGAMAGPSLRFGTCTALRWVWGAWRVGGPDELSTPPIGSFLCIPLTPVVMSPTSTLTEPCLQIFASPEAGFRPCCFLAFKTPLKAAGLSVRASCHVHLPWDCFFHAHFVPLIC